MGAGDGEFAKVDFGGGPGDAGGGEGGRSGIFGGEVVAGGDAAAGGAGSRGMIFRCGRGLAGAISWMARLHVLVENPVAEAAEIDLRFSGLPGDFDMPPVGDGSSNTGNRRRGDDETEVTFRGATAD